MYYALLFSRSVLSDSLQPHGLQHTRLPCPSLSPGVLLKLMSIESVILSNYLILCCPYLLLPLIFPSIRVFLNESTLRIDGQSIRASASASVLPMNIQGCTSRQISSVQFSHSVVSDSLRPHESQHTRPPCPSPSPGVHSDSRPSSP